MLRSIQEELRRSGFDLCHPIHTSWYNNLIDDEGLIESGTLKELPAPAANIDGEDASNCNALLIGNTKEIWPMFLEWLAAKVEQQKVADQNATDEGALESVASPFDTFVEQSIPRAIRRSCRDYAEVTSYEMFWSNGTKHKVNLDPSCVDEVGDGSNDAKDYHCYKDDENAFLVSMQRVALTTGEYWLDNDATKLCVHPEYGTWTSFRTVVVFETKDLGRTSIPPAPSHCPCPVSDEEIKVAKTVFDYALGMSSTGEGYGTTVNKSWNELCTYLHGTVCSGSTWEKVPDNMKPWIQLRDSFSVGRKEWKYSQPQLLYHYTKDPDILSAELRRIKKSG